MTDNNIKILKDNLRKKIIPIRDKLTEEQVSQISLQIHQNLLSLKEVLKAKNIFTYISVNNEVDTRQLINTLLVNKYLFVPYITSTKECEMHPCRLVSLQKTIPGKYNIPSPANFVKTNINDIEVTLLPCVAFDPSGVRIGSGKGYYDRLLRGYPGLKIGLAYSFQITGKLPLEPHDILMDYIITEKGIIQREN